MPNPPKAHMSSHGVKIQKYQVVSTRKRVNDVNYTVTEQRMLVGGGAGPRTGRCEL